MTDGLVAGQTVGRFLESLGARTPSPGGGATSALAGALGAAQLLMVAEYASWKPEDADPRERLKLLVSLLLDLAQQDADAYGAYAEARPKRKEDPAPYAKTQLGITEVPARVMERCVEAGEFAPDVLVRAPKWFAGDVLVAATCLETGASGARTFVVGNLSGLPADARPGFVARLAEADARLDRARRKLEPLLLPRLPAS